MGPEASPDASPLAASAQKLRPIQIWVPDVHSPEFAAEARRQCVLANASEEEAEIQASFIDSVYEWPDDEYSQ
jgi:hypothetical protein